MAYLSKVFSHYGIRRGDSHDIRPAVNIIAKADIATNCGHAILEENLGHGAITPYPHLPTLSNSRLLHHSDNVKAAGGEYNLSISCRGSRYTLPFYRGMPRPVDMFNEEASLVGGGIRA